MKPRINLKVRWQGRAYHQPKCRMKLGPDGGIMILVKHQGKWRNVKAKILELTFNKRPKRSKK